MPNSDPQSIFSRRDFFRLSTAGVLTTSMSGWLDVLAAHAAGSGRKHKSCILLWMDGGPSHKDTFDMKPDTENAGDFKPIPTSVPGIQISEHFPKLAQLMQHAAILRSMSTGEGAHGRAKYYMHTGYQEGVGGLVYPSLGAIVSAELGQSESPVAELRLDRQSQLRRRLPRRTPSTAHRQRSCQGRREPEAARRQRSSSATASVCSKRWSRASSASYKATPYRRPPDDLPAGRAADAVQGSQGVRPRAGAGGGQGCLRRHQVRRRLSAGPPARRSGHPVRRSDAGRLGHASEQLRARQETVRRGRSGDERPGRRPQESRPARQHADRLDGRVRPDAEDQHTRRQARPRPLSPRLEHRAAWAAASRAAR